MSIFRRPMRITACIVVFVALQICAPAVQAQDAGEPSRPLALSPAQLFEFADKARDAGDFAVAEKAYRALSQNIDVEIRSEARFRLGLMFADRQRRYREAAIEFRRILDDKPDAARVRLELARMHAQLGNIRAAERELRASEAAGLPPEVERLVRFFANSLNSRKRVGGSLELAIAPDSNINRATRSDTLGTIIGDFALNDDAKAKSGIGLDLRGQAYWRHAIGKGTDLLVRASTSADVYRYEEFNDIVAGLQVGTEHTIGADRLSLSVGPTWRWYGQKPFSTTLGATASWRHASGKRSQVRIEGTLSRLDNKFNDLQDSHTYALSASLDRAFSSRTGGGVQLYAFREAARDPAYSTVIAGASIYAFREAGRTTFVATAGYSRLEADKRLALFRQRRSETRLNASMAATLRALQVEGFAPFVRVRWERNSSSVELYDYSRVAGEFGVTTAF